MDKTDPAYKGQSGYNPAMLAVYDVWVLGFMSRAVLHVPVPRFVELYRANVGHRRRVPDLAEGGSHSEHGERDREERREPGVHEFCIGLMWWA